MTPIDHELLASRMAAMIDDAAMVVPFVADFGDRLEHVIAGILASYGRRDLLRDRDELAGLVWDVALALQARASGWDSAHGVAPWTWAGGVVHATVAAAVGHRTSDIDADDLERVLGPVASTIGGTGDVDLDTLAGEQPLVALWLAATRAVASEHHARVHLEYRVQLMLGDPSPSHTVAEQLGISPANVRQIDRRVRVKLEALVRSDPTFRDLGRFAWLGRGAQSRAGPVLRIDHRGAAA